MPATKNSNNYTKQILALVAIATIFGIGYAAGSTRENMIPALPSSEAAYEEYQGIEEEGAARAEENSREASTDPMVFTSEELGFTLTLPAQYSVLTTITSVFALDSNTNGATVSFELPLNLPRNEGPISQTMFGIGRYPADYDTSNMGPGGGGLEIGRSDNGYVYTYIPVMDLAIDQDLPEYQIFLSLSATAQEDVQKGFKIIE